MMTAVIVSGSSALATLAAGSLTASGIIMLAPVVFGAIDIAWNLTGRARDHEFLARRFSRIAMAVNVEDADPSRLEKWRAKVLGVYEDEPAVYHALNAECGNAATQALGYGSDQFQVIPRWRHFLRHWLRFSATDFPRG